MLEYGQSYITDITQMKASVRCTTNHMEILLHGHGARLTIGKDVMRALNKPKYITIRVSKNLDTIAIAPCDARDVMSFKAPEKLFLDSHCTFSVYSKRFVSNVMVSNGLDCERSYSVGGIYIESSNMVIFPFVDKDIMYQSDDESESACS